MIPVIAFSKLQPPLPSLFGAVLPKMPAFFRSFFFERILTAYLVSSSSLYANFTIP